jgi:hypothetical protein
MKYTPNTDIAHENNKSKTAQMLNSVLPLFGELAEI